MIAFLTSSPGGSYIEDGMRKPCELNRMNGFVETLKQYWKQNTKCLLISSDPQDTRMNDSMRETFRVSFSLSGLPLEKCDVLDWRNDDLSGEEIADYDVIILSGGHVPTQNAFFGKIRLKEKLKGFGGVVIGISAGTMNSADVVYAQPELQGEADNPEYQRFLKGLGITKLMILPHYKEIKEEVLDGKGVMEDITYPDSMGERFYALVDGSYIIVSKEETRLFGEAYLIEDGRLSKLCEENDSLRVAGDCCNKKKTG